MGMFLNYHLFIFCPVSESRFERVMLTRIVAKLALAVVLTPVVPVTADQCRLYFPGCFHCAAVTRQKGGGQRQASNGGSITVPEMPNKGNRNKLFYKAFVFHRNVVSLDGGLKKSSFIRYALSLLEVATSGPKADDKLIPVPG